MPEESTTPDLVEVTRRMMDALNRRDLAAYMAFYATDAVFDLSDVGIGTFEGVEAIRGFFDDWHGNWEDYLVEVDEVLDLGRGVVFAAYREGGRLVGSEGRVEQRRGRVAVWVQGRLERVTNYLDIDEARAAAERLAEERR
jgi:ketosteroid isomerase-like protein